MILATAVYFLAYRTVQQPLNRYDRESLRRGYKRTLHTACAAQPRSQGTRVEDIVTRSLSSVCGRWYGFTCLRYIYIEMYRYTLTPAPAGATSCVSHYKKYTSSVDYAFLFCVLPEVVLVSGFIENQTTVYPTKGLCSTQRQFLAKVVY